LPGDPVVAMFRWDATGAMAKVCPPLLVLAGDLDIVTKPEAGEIIALEHKGADFRKIDGVNPWDFGTTV